MASTRRVNRSYRRQNGSNSLQMWTARTPEAITPAFRLSDDTETTVTRRWKPTRFAPKSGDALPNYFVSAMHSISTLALKTSPATPTVERAGGSLGKNFV
jgi:hypothetical protein